MDSYSVSFCVLPPQDQLSADMYSFVAKEIDYANYFQTVSIQKGEAAWSLLAGVTVGMGRNVVLESRICQACPENRWGFDCPTCE